MNSGLIYPRNPALNSKLIYPQKIDNDLTRLIGNVIDTNQRELRALLVQNGYTSLDDYECLKEAAIDFVSKGDMQMSSVFALHPLFDVMIDANNVLWEAQQINQNNMPQRNEPQVIKIDTTTKKETFNPFAPAPVMVAAKDDEKKIFGIPLSYVCAGLVVLLVTILIVK